MDVRWCMRHPSCCEVAKGQIELLCCATQSLHSKQQGLAFQKVEMRARLLHCFGGPSAELSVYMKHS